MSFVSVAVLAAGSGTRFGSDKTIALLGGKLIYLWSVEAFLRHPRVSEVILVKDSSPDFLPNGVRVVPGGTSRAESSRRALEAVSPECEVLLIHDAARPFVTPEIIDAVIDGCLEVGAAAPGIPVVDTVRAKAEKEILDRSRLVAMQTPQGARVERFRNAEFDPNATDDMVGLGSDWKIVPGDPENFKITTLADLRRAELMLQKLSETRTGIGYDVHRFSDDPARPLWLGGVHFPGEIGLEGHSDADAVLHACVDALLGAAALGDIGQHFPPSDPQWKNAPSLRFLGYAAELLRANGWQIVNLDISVIAERPKVMPRADEIRSAISRSLGVDTTRVSIKATTNEGLGAIGRGEGIAAFATATIRTAN